jgi:hypothetical protein
MYPIKKNKYYSLFHFIFKVVFIQPTMSSSFSPPSSFSDFRKIFLKIPCSSSAFRSEKRKEVFNGNSNSHVFHLTLLIFHVRKDNLPRFLENIQKYFKSLSIPKSFVANGLGYELLGTRPERLVLTFDSSSFPISDFKTIVCEFLQSEFEYVKSASSVPNEDGELYDVFNDENGVPIVRMSSNQPQEKYCVDLLSSFDLKRFNKSIFARYCDSEDKKEFLKTLLDPLEENAIVDLAPEVTLSFTNK